MADPTKAWDKAFTSGSKVMQDRLKKVHAKNPAFQSWLKSSGHGAGESVKQASKEVKPTVRAKQLAAASATAYGATKGLAVGGEHGGAGVSQKADKGRVWSPDEVAALNKQRGTEPVQLTPAQMRMAAIKAAAEKSVAKKAKSFDVPTLQRQHDDLRDVHDSLHSKVTRSSMDEEVELDEMDKSQPSSRRGAEGLALGKKANPVKRDKVKSGALKILQKQYKKVKEEVEQIDELKKKTLQSYKSKAQNEIESMAKDLRGKEYQTVNPQKIKNRASGIKLATAKLKKEEVELEEGKIAKALAVGAMSLASMGAKAHTDTTKSVAQLAAERPALAQRLQDIGATGQVPASDVRAAELQRKQDQEMPASERRAKELKKEEVEQIDEANMRFDYEAAARPKSSDVKNFLNRNKNRRAAAATKKYIRRMTKLGGLGPNQTKKDTEAHMKAYFEEVEQIDEVTKQEAEAALGGPVKEKPTMPPGKQPAGHRYVRNLARRAMKAGLKKEEAEQVDERNLENKKKKDNWVRAKGVEAAIKGKVPFDRGHSPLRSGREVLAREDIMNEEPKDAADAGEYDYEGDMAKSQLRSIMHNAKRMHDMLEDNTNLPEWVQSKITLAEDYISTTANYMQGEMNEESEISEEGKIAVTPSEKSLAKYHGNPNKITYGDVIKARIRSAAKKAIEG